MDIQNRVRLVRTEGNEEGIEAGICLNVDKHAGEPGGPPHITKSDKGVWGLYGLWSR